MENKPAKNDNELVELEGVKITRGQIDLIKRTIFIGASDDEMRLFFYECRRRGVHPMDRQIYPVSRKDKDGNRRVTFQMGIDYLRSAAEETSRYVGQKPIQYGPMTKEGEINVPEWAEVTVLRKDPEGGEVTDIPHRAYWKEYYPGEALGFMWRKMPMNQLGKCAEAGALRKAFPRKLGGLYINEEMEQAEAVPFTPIMEPQRKNGEKPPEAPALPSVTVGISQVEIKSGKGKETVDPKTGKKIDGKPWTLYIVHAGPEKYNTFSKSFGELAQRSIDEQLNAVISWSESEKGKKLENILILEDRQPGEDDAEQS